MADNVAPADEATPGPAPDPVTQGLISQFGRMQERLLDELAAIHDARARLSARAETQLRRYLADDSPRVKGLRATAAQSKALAAAFSTAAATQRAARTDAPATERKRPAARKPATPGPTRKRSR